MNGMSTTTTTPHTDAKPCHCGGTCDKCRGECCELECLVQPRFFCGQLLTDQDLSALVDWVKGKTALSRYRHGWGVVCGLDVHCTNDHEGFVTVGPGYAIDCCGNDIVICRDATIDLSKYCGDEKDPCGRWDPASWRGAQVGSIDAEEVRFGPWSVPKAEIVSVELRVRYAESLTAAKSGLARGGCDGTAVCEYSRAVEGHELYAVAAEGCEDLSVQQAGSWYEHYYEELSKLLAALSALYVEQDPKRTIARLLAWIERYPLHGFCFVHEWLCYLRQADTLPDYWFRDALFWIVQDWRNRVLECDCFGCGPETGVPLARIWMWRRRDRYGKRHCTVLYINQHPPFRRPLSRECWPAAPGTITLAPFIWQRPEDVCTRLRDMGVALVETEPFQAGNVMELRERFRSERLILPCNEVDERGGLVAHYVEDHCGHRRIVMFGDRRGADRDNTDNAVPRPEPNQPRSLDLEEVDGIGDGFARRLSARGIEDLRALAQATPEQVHDALAGLSMSPDVERCRHFIKQAKALLGEE